MQIYIKRDNQDYGPYPREEALEYINQGVFQRTDMAWHDGMSEWVPLERVLGIATAPQPPMASVVRGPALQTPSPTAQQAAMLQYQAVARKKEAVARAKGRKAATPQREKNVAFKIALNAVLLLAIVLASYIKFGKGGGVVRQYLAPYLPALSAPADEHPAPSAAPVPESPAVANRQPVVAAPSPVSSRSFNSADVTGSPATSPVATSVVPSANPAQTQSIPTDGLQMWLKADAGVTAGAYHLVSTWADQSANGNNATQTTEGNQPALVANALNGKPVVRFDGSSSYLNLSPALNSASALPVTLVIVTCGSSVPDGAFDSAPAHANSFRFFRGAVELWDHSPALPLVTPRSGAITSVIVNVNARGNRQLDVYLNGVEQGGGALLGNTAPVTISNGQIGRVNIGPYYNGDIAEVILYNRALASAEREQVEGYLKAKYLGSAPLASNTLAQAQSIVESYMRKNAAPQSALTFLDWSDFSATGQTSAITVRYRLVSPSTADTLTAVRFSLEGGNVVKAEVVKPIFHPAVVPLFAARPAFHPQVIDRFSEKLAAARHGGKMTLHLHNAFSLAQLEEAKKKAIDERKPLGFIMVWDKFFEIRSDPSDGTWGNSALVHYYEVFNDQLVLVFVPHERGLGLVPDAAKKGFLGPDEGGYAPNMAVTDATATEFIVEIPYRHLDAAGREELFAAGGKKIDEWLASHPDAIPVAPQAAGAGTAENR